MVFFAGAFLAELFLRVLVPFLPKAESHGRRPRGDSEYSPPACVEPFPGELSLRSTRRTSDNFATHRESRRVTWMHTYPKVKAGYRCGGGVLGRLFAPHLTSLSRFLGVFRHVLRTPCLDSHSGPR